MCLGYFNYKTLFLDCMRTKREQFPINWLTYGSLEGIQTLTKLFVDWLIYSDI